MCSDNQTMKYTGEHPVHGDWTEKYCDWLGGGPPPQPPPPPPTCEEDRRYPIEDPCICSDNQTMKYTGRMVVAGGGRLSQPTQKHCESIVVDCRGNPGGGAVVDVCNVCDGDGTSCIDCAGNVRPDGIGAATLDSCGECLLQNDPRRNNCVGCDGIANSGAKIDECGVCGGSGIPADQCDCNGNLLDECGVCGGLGIPAAQCDCDGNVLDDCGVCGGDNSSCVDCRGTPNGSAVVDACGECGGDNSKCAGCDGVPNSGVVEDECDVCGGDNSTCAGCDGEPNSGVVEDECGVCNGDGSSCPIDCFDVPGGSAVLDVCGICGGDGTSCNGCDGIANSGLIYDECGVCGGSGIPADECDCNGNVLDECEVCGGQNECIGPNITRAQAEAIVTHNIWVREQAEAIQERMRARNEAAAYERERQREIEEQTRHAMNIDWVTVWEDLREEAGSWEDAYALFQTEGGPDADDRRRNWRIAEGSPRYNRAESLRMSGLHSESIAGMVSRARAARDAAAEERAAAFEGRAATRAADRNAWFAEMAELGRRGTYEYKISERPAYEQAEPETPTGGGENNAAVACDVGWERVTDAAECNISILERDIPTLNKKLPLQNTVREPPGCWVYPALTTESSPDMLFYNRNTTERSKTSYWHGGSSENAASKRLVCKRLTERLSDVDLSVQGGVNWVDMQTERFMEAGSWLAARRWRIVANQSADPPRRAEEQFFEIALKSNNPSALQAENLRIEGEKEEMDALKQEVDYVMDSIIVPARSIEDQFLEGAALSTLQWRRGGRFAADKVAREVEWAVEAALSMTPPRGMSMKNFIMRVSEQAAREKVNFLATTPWWQAMIYPFDTVLVCPTYNQSSFTAASERCPGQEKPWLLKTTEEMEGLMDTIPPPDTSLIQIIGDHWFNAIELRNHYERDGSVGWRSRLIGSDLVADPDGPLQPGDTSGVPLGLAEDTYEDLLGEQRRQREERDRLYEQWTKHSHMSCYVSRYGKEGYDPSADPFRSKEERPAWTSEIEAINACAEDPNCAAVMQGATCDKAENDPTWYWRDREFYHCPHSLLPSYAALAEEGSVGSIIPDNLWEEGLSTRGRSSCIRIKPGVNLDDIKHSTLFEMYWRSPGCTDPQSPNYDYLAKVDDGSCQPEPEYEPGSDIVGTYLAAPVRTERSEGCMDPRARNYNPSANVGCKLSNGETCCIIGASQAAPAAGSDSEVFLSHREAWEADTSAPQQDAFCGSTWVPIDDECSTCVDGQEIQAYRQSNGNLIKRCLSIGHMNPHQRHMSDDILSR